MSDNQRYGDPPAYTASKDVTRRLSSQTAYSSEVAVANRRALLAGSEDPPPPPPPHRHPGPAALNTGHVPSPYETYSRHSLQGVDGMYGIKALNRSPERDSFASTPLNHTLNSTSFPGPKSHHQSHDSQNSLTPLVAAQPPSPVRTSTPGRPYSAMSIHDHFTPGSAYYYHGDGYDDFDPGIIADDGDDGLNEPSVQRDKRNSYKTGAAANAAIAGSMFGGSNSRVSNSQYGAVAGHQDLEKSEWLATQNTGGRRLRLIVGSIIIVIVLGAIIGGVVGGVLAHEHSSDSSKGKGSSSSGSPGSSGGSSNGLWTIHSPEIQAVLNNKDLHKVFPGMDYTPTNAQYPDCLSNPVDQNNVTLDMAILSQLTPAVRLYGTDCAQTEMVLTGINQLGYNDSMQVWLGVYLGTNDTTNARQISQMWSILTNNPSSRFAGIIVGNEAIFEGGMTSTQLALQLDSIRANLTALHLSPALPLATSQLGDDWSEYPALVAHTDIVMSNVHPYFAGVTAQQGAAWAWTFWQGNDFPLTAGNATGSTGGSGGATYPRQVISEIGWPTQGGRDCGDASSPSYGCVNGTDAPTGAVANLTNLNTFMESWVCPAMANTTYFWFEAFDEPWKSIYNTEYDHWEPHWGLFDSNRVLKPGITIPTCGGKTISNPYGT